MTTVSTVTTSRSDPQADPADRARIGRLLGAGLWLFFLSNPLGALLANDDLAERYAGLVALAVFVVVYLHGLSRIPQFHIHRQYALAWSYVGIMLGCFAVVVPGAGDESLTCLVFVGAMCVAILPTWQAGAAVVVLFVATTAAGYGIDGWSPHGNNFAVLLAAAAVFSFRMA